MQSTAIHTRLFGLVCNSPQRSNIFTGIYVSIHIVFAVIAFKYLSFSIAYAVAVTTSLACISWINQNNRNTIKNSFVGNILAQLIERPLANSCSKFLTFFQRRKANAFKVFQSNALVFFFSNLNNLFGNRVVSYRSCGTFSATKPFQEFFTSSCAFALNGASYFLSFFSIILKFFRVKFFPITKGCNRNQTKIHTHEGFYVFNIFFGNINGLKKVELPFLVNQIRFAFYVGKIVRIMANKRYFNPSTNSPQRNNIVRLVGHYPAVITNASKWSEYPLNLFVKFVSISNLCNTPYQYLTAKFKGSLVSVVNFVMEFEIIKDFFRPSHIRNRITNSISFLHRLEKQVSLFISRQKFYFQCEFHLLLNMYKNTKNFLYQKIILNFFNFKGVSVSLSSHPHLSVMSGFHAPSL